MTSFLRLCQLRSIAYTLCGIKVYTATLYACQTQAASHYRHLSALGLSKRHQATGLLHRETRDQIYMRVGRYWNCSKNTSAICCIPFKRRENAKKNCFWLVTASGLVTTFWVILYSLSWSNKGWTFFSQSGLYGYQKT
jgi:hypothetical protein